MRAAAICRASPRTVSAGTSVIAAAQAASFGCPSAAPIRYGRTRSKPLQYRSRNAASWRPSATNVCASASIIAVSVFGRIGSHSGLTLPGRPRGSG